MKKKLAWLMIVFCLILGGAVNLVAANTGKNGLKVLVTTFPIYQITRNVTKGVKGGDVQLLLPSQLGCPHDYALTPQDLRKLSKADVFIVNGLGMEEFLGAPLKKVNANLLQIDSSKGVKNLLEFTEEQQHEEKHDHHEAHEHHDAHKHNHDHSGINPHLFASPRMVARLANNIAAGLAKADPANAAAYEKNARAYAMKMNKLADEMSAVGKSLANKRIIQPHGIFDYLARDIGLEIVGVMQPHGAEPSAAEMLDLVKKIRAKKVGVIFTEPQYSGKVGRTLAKETGIPVAVLDPVASGPENAPLDYYEKTMRKNMKTLEKNLGKK